LVVNDETNLLRLITPWLDNSCQIKPKRATTTFSQIFRELNTPCVIFGERGKANQRCSPTDLGCRPLPNSLGQLLFERGESERSGRRRQGRRSSSPSMALWLREVVETAVLPPVGGGTSSFRVRRRGGGGVVVKK